jgi:hypothetical protein
MIKEEIDTKKETIDLYFSKTSIRILPIKK